MRPNRLKNLSPLFPDTLLRTVFSFVGLSLVIPCPPLAFDS